MKIEAIIFDNDGVILNTEMMWGEVWAIIAKKHNCPSFAKAHNCTVGINGEEAREAIFNYLKDLPRDQVEMMVKEAREYGFEYINNNVEKMPYLDEILNYIESKNIRKMIATNTDKEVSYIRLNKHNLIERFEYVLCGDEIKNRKPNPEIYIKACKMLNVNPKNTVVVEDSKYGVIAATKAGCNVIGVPSVNEFDLETKEKTIATVNNLKDAINIIDKLLSW